MMIGIYGPHAVGKTTFLHNYLDAFGDAARKPLHVVCADNPIEWELAGDTWLEQRRHAWKEDRPAKLPLMRTAILDSGVWVVESARFFSGFGPELISFVKEGGALKFIIPVVHPNLMRQFIQERCIKNSQTFNAPYWDEARLRYESHDRYMNFVNKHMRPAGIECVAFEIDGTRAAWASIFNQIARWM